MLTPLPMDCIVVRRQAAAGDVVQAAPIVAALTSLGYPAIIECDARFRPILDRMKIPQCETGQIDECDVDLDGAYEGHPVEERKQRSIRSFYIQAALEQLRVIGIDLDPFSIPMPSMPKGRNESKIAFLTKFPRPWIVICPRSCSPVNCVTRSGIYNQSANRTVPDAIWNQAANMVDGTCFWLSTHAEPPAGKLVDLAANGFLEVIEWIELMDAVATVDTGIMHIAGALRVPVAVVFQAFDPALTYEQCPNQLVIKPSLKCLGCTLQICPIDPVNPPCQQVDPSILVAAITQLCHLQTINPN